MGMHPYYYILYSVPSRAGWGRTGHPLLRGLRTRIGVRTDLPGLGKMTHALCGASLGVPLQRAPGKGYALYAFGRGRAAGAQVLHFNVMRSSHAAVSAVASSRIWLQAKG